MTLLSSRHLLIALGATGIAVRLVFLLLAGNLELQSDEANYVYQAISWNHFGFYSDSFRYLWPPGYPLLIAVSLEAFGVHGLFAVKLLQVALSSVIGVTIMLLAQRLFGAGAATIAGIIWVGYLPLIGFTHYLWAEIVFLALLVPASYLLLGVLQERYSRPDVPLIAAGALFGAALYFKEVTLYLAPVMACVLVYLVRERSWAEGVRRGTLFLLALAVVVTPWTLRNFEVYGRFVPMGTSLGENAYHGLNASYTNFDLLPVLRGRGRHGALEIGSRGWFTRFDPADRWDRATEIPNTADRLAENTRRGLRHAAAHPGWLVRSRIKKAADLVVPLSYFVRHEALGRYADSPLGKSGVRRLLACFAVFCSAAVMLLAIPGYFLVLKDRPGRWLIGSIVIYVVTTSLLVANSRFRMPMVPFLIVLSAGLLAHLPLRVREPRSWLPVAVWTLALLLLWWVDLPELRAIIGVVWQGSP